MAELLVDTGAGVECLIFGSCCMITLLFFCHVIYKLCRSPSAIAKHEVMIIALSSIQLALGSWYYILDMAPALHILGKGIKVVQCEIISWTCISKVFNDNNKYKSVLRVFFISFTIVLLVVLLYSLFTVSNDNVYFNMEVNIAVSTLWFAMSLVVLYIVLFIVKSKVNFNFQFEDDIIQLDLEGNRQTNIESFTNNKYTQFMGLSIVESITATGTLIWDVIIYRSVTRSVDGKYLELDMDFIKEFLYIISSSLFIIIPNWSIYYIFYWLQRWHYSALTSNWDINLSDLRYKSASQSMA